MNKPRSQYLLLCTLFMPLLAGCFGGKVPPVRAERQQRAETALSRGIRAEQKGDFTEADKLLTEALTISSSIEDNPLRITSLINLARLHRLQHDLPGAESYLDQALVLEKSVSPLFAETTHEKALLELANGNPSGALLWAQQSIAAEQGNSVGSRHNLAARIQLELGNWSAADLLARTALGENRSARQAEEEANSLRIMGIVARHEKKYIKGEQLLQDALLIDKRIGRSSKIAVDLEELAAGTQSAGKLKQSVEYLERAYTVNVSDGRLQQAILNQESLASNYVLLGEVSKAAAARATAAKLSLQLKSQQPHGASETINPSNRP